MPRTTPKTFMQPQQPDAVLAAIVGSDPLPRTEITKKLWAFIKAKGLQDATERRRINANDNAEFRAFIGGADSATMFELPKFVNAHVTPVEI